MEEGSEGKQAEAMDRVIIVQCPLAS